ncbi:MAG: helix-turn-helix transcriptional regulator [Clostridia bacterium]|nr:helix-turn-helix transcriptional regulator [Clostridia bacterium]
MLPIAGKIRSLRRAKNVTQEELADALNVTFQSVSRWETGQTYPDITLVPKIAAYFEVTTDELLVSDEETREREIHEIFRDCQKASEQEEDPLRRYEMRRKALSALPKNHRYAYRLMELVVRDLIFYDTLPREEALPVVREFCETLLNQPVDLYSRKLALSHIFDYEDEDRLADWKKYAIDYSLENQLMEHRFYVRDEYDRHNLQMQQNLWMTFMRIFPCHLTKIHPDDGSAEERTARENLIAADTAFRLYDLFREDRDNDYDIFIEPRAWNWLFIAKCRFRLGETEEAYDALEKSVALFEKFFTIPEDTELRCSHYCFDLLYVGWNRFGLYNGGDMRSYHHNLMSALNVEEGQWEWFRPHMHEERFAALREKAKSFDPYRRRLMQ